jgi:hypothetical protein
MPGATEHLRSRLWAAILRRRAPQWLLAPSHRWSWPPTC